LPPLLGVGRLFPSGRFAVSVDSTKVYVASGDGTVAVIDAATNSVVGSVSTGGALTGIAVKPPPGNARLRHGAFRTIASS